MRKTYRQQPRQASSGSDRTHRGSPNQSMQRSNRTEEGEAFRAFHLKVRFPCLTMVSHFVTRFEAGKPDNEGNPREVTTTRESRTGKASKSLERTDHCVRSFESYGSQTTGRISLNTPSRVDGFDVDLNPSLTYDGVPKRPVYGRRYAIRR